MTHNAADLLRRGFGVAHVAGTAEGTCARCGEYTTQGVPLHTILKPTASDLLDTFRWPSGVVCGSCAACYSEPRLFTGSIFATQSVGLKPTVTTQPGRTRWLDLLSSPDLLFEENVAIMTSNTKRRLWPGAVVSAAPIWRPLFVHDDTERVLSVDVAALADCLAVVGEIYRTGFSKAAMETSLLASLSVTRDADQLLAYERELQRWRGTDEFLVSLFVVQKE